MTTIPAPHATTRTIIGATPFERTLLRAASGLDVFVAARLERRRSAAYRDAAAAQSAAAGARIAAEARGAIGLLPR